MTVVADIDDIKRVENLLLNIASDMKEMRNDILSLKPSDSSGLLTVKEASKYYNVDESTIRRWIKNGSAKSKKIGGTVYMKKK